MKKMMIVMVILAAASSTQAAYTYTYGSGTGFGSLTLLGTESVLVNGGGGLQFHLFDNSYGRIESTSRTSYNPSFGIGTIIVANSSSLVVTGGEIGDLLLNGPLHVTLSGGTVEHLALATGTQGGVTNIEIICKSWVYNSGTELLTGIWGNDAPFRIQLGEEIPWPIGSTFDSIDFTIVPEPLSLGLLALGGLLVRRYRRAG
jgi:hypothetical protein